MTEPVLEFEEVVCAPRTAREAALAALSFQLAPGQGLVLLTPTGGDSPVADLASGLRPADAGRVRYAGRGWADRSPDEAAFERQRIGRVFTGRAWVGNLDVDENITLARRSRRPGASEEPWPERLAAWAERFGLAGRLVGRPSAWSAGDLQRAQWVRALLAAESLLLLEHPLREVYDPWPAALVAAVEERVRAGVAAVWVTDRPGAPEPAGFRRIRWDGGARAWQEEA